MPRIGAGPRSGEIQELAHVDPHPGMFWPLWLGLVVHSVTWHQGISAGGGISRGGFYSRAATQLALRLWTPFLGKYGWSPSFPYYSSRAT